MLSANTYKELWPSSNIIHDVCFVAACLRVVEAAAHLWSLRFCVEHLLSLRVMVCIGVL